MIRIHGRTIALFTKQIQIIIMYVFPGQNNSLVLTPSLKDGYRFNPDTSLIDISLESLFK